MKSERKRRGRRKEGSELKLPVESESVCLSVCLSAHLLCMFIHSVDGIITVFAFSVLDFPSKLQIRTLLHLSIHSSSNHSLPRGLSCSGTDIVYQVHTYLLTYQLRYLHYRTSPGVSSLSFFLSFFLFFFSSCISYIHIPYSGCIDWPPGSKALQSSGKKATTN